MTGKDLIIYILQNSLENEEVFKDGNINFDLFGLMSAEEAAAKFNVGMATVVTWRMFNNLEGVQIGDSLYFMKNATDPRKDEKWKS